MDTPDLLDAVRAVPALCQLRAGAISRYFLHTEASSAPALVSVLRAASGGGKETPEGWPPETAEFWQFSDEFLAEILPGLPWCPRWAAIDDQRLSTVNVGSPQRPLLRRVLVDESDELPVKLGEIAQTNWSNESRGAPISWSGGNTLSVIAKDTGWAPINGETSGRGQIGRPAPIEAAPGARDRKLGGHGRGGGCGSTGSATARSP